MDREQEAKVRAAVRNAVVAFRKSYGKRAYASARELALELFSENLNKEVLVQEKEHKSPVELARLSVQLRGKLGYTVKWRRDTNHREWLVVTSGHGTVYRIEHAGDRVRVFIEGTQMEVCAATTVRGLVRTLKQRGAQAKKDRWSLP